MKQARYWLLMAAAMLLPQAAYAQARKPGAKPPATAPKPPPTAPPAGGAGGDVGDLDAPGGAPAPGGDAGAVPPAGGDTGAPATGSSGGICEIDPSACPKASDIQALSNKNVRADVYAVQQIYALRRGRVELMPYWSFSLNDQFVSHLGPGLGVNYYLTNVLAIGFNGTFHQPFNGDSDFNFQNRRATRLAVPLNEYQAAGTVNFTYVPMYGKFSGFSQFIFHYDGYIVGGVGALRTRPISVIDPDNRKFDYDWRLAFSLGIGLRVFLNRWFAVTAEVRDYIYVEQLEAVNVQGTQAAQRDPATWFGEKPLTNNVQAQLGISMFLPFSWEYRLPK
jgi:outer membrane beta-barrel protein